jgi:hypothetical protein
MPGRRLPALAATAVVILAAPVFLVAGWSLRGWLLAATLWLGVQGFSLLVMRFSPGAGATAKAAAVGFAIISRSFVAGVVLVLVAVSDRETALAAALLYALAFTVELALSLLSYYSAEPL